jgi:hypothetical protein
MDSFSVVIRTRRRAFRLGIFAKITQTYENVRNNLEEKKIPWVKEVEVIVYQMRGDQIYYYGHMDSDGLLTLRASVPKL